MEPLNKDISPLNYKVYFDLLGMENQDNFSGIQVIKMKAQKPFSKILLNIKNIKVSNVKLSSGKETIDITGTSRIKHNNENQILTIDLGKEFPEGEFQLSMDFQAKLGLISSLHRSIYKEKDKEKYLLSTKMEPADCRAVFPCIDEPEAKATFDISMMIPDDFKGISNMKVKNKENKTRGKLLSFHTTPVMSTYLFYIGVGEFEFLEGKFENIDIRIVTTPGKSKKYGKFALEATIKFMDYFQKYFEIKYPLDKLDMIAIPDFGSGAMENWGAITFREDALLYNPEDSSLSGKQRVAEVISHELAHQWFGNLVTMKWWNDLWLNESFADYMTYKAIEIYYPELDPWGNFLNKRVNEAYALDSLKNSHPINVDIQTPDEIEEVFDAISYSKGGMVLRMLDNYLGNEAFRKGLNAYLKAYEYGNAEGIDLWKHLANVSGKPVEKIMDAWLNKTGFPLITVSMKENKLSLSQERFLYSGTENITWEIPVNVKKNGEKPEYILFQDSTMEIPGYDKQSWIKLNSGETGFYRVKYPEKVLQGLREAISNKELDSFDRWGLHNDLFALCIANKIKIDDYLEFLEYCNNEDSYIVLMDVLGSLKYLLLICADESFIGLIQNKARKLCHSVLSRLKWEPVLGEPETNKIIRNMAIEILGKLGDKDILDKTSSLFSKILESKNSVDPDFRRVVYRLAAWNGEEKTYEEIFNLYEKAENPEEKLHLLCALGCCKNKELLKKTLDIILTDSVRNQNIYPLCATISSNPNGRKLVWPWIMKNWAEIKKIMEGYIMHFNFILKRLSTVADAEVAKEIEIFLMKDMIPGTQRALSQLVENMSANQVFLDNCRKNLK